MIAEPFRVAIEDPQPSQLFLNGRKLHDVSDWFDFDDPRYDPLSVLYLDEKLVFYPLRRLHSWFERRFAF